MTAIKASYIAPYETQEDVLLQKLMKYYTESKLDEMLKIINGESIVSLRLIDWFVTNYAKYHFTVIITKKTQADGTKRFKVYNRYKNELGSYQKKKLDPFCRYDRILIPYKNETHIQTTIGQLNFFRWAFDNNIIEYIIEHYDDIVKDMNSRSSSSFKNKTNTSKNKTRKARQELSICASKYIKKENVEITLNFKE